MATPFPASKNDETLKRERASSKTTQWHTAFSALDQQKVIHCSGNAQL